MHQLTVSTPKLTCLVNEVGMSFAVANTGCWQAVDLSHGKRQHSYPGMIAAAGKPSHGSRKRPQTA